MCLLSYASESSTAPAFLFNPARSVCSPDVIEAFDDDEVLCVACLSVIGDAVGPMAPVVRSFATFSSFKKSSIDSAGTDGLRLLCKPF